MAYSYRTLVAGLLFAATTPAAQSEADAQKSDGELLSPVVLTKSASLTARNELQVGKSEYWAKPGRIGIFKLNLDLLERKGAIVTITLFDDPPITVLSKGMHRDPETGYVVATWTGEIQAPNGRDTYPIEWGITTFAVDADGRYSPPGRFRKLHEEQAGNRVSVLPSEAYAQSEQQVADSVTGRINLPHLKSRYAVVPLEKDLEYVTIYEMDEDKSFITYDEFESDPTTPEAIESRRRADKYRQYLDNLERRLGEKNESEVPIK